MSELTTLEQIEALRNALDAMDRWSAREGPKHRILATFAEQGGRLRGLRPFRSDKASELACQFFNIAEDLMTHQFEIPHPLFVTTEDNVISAAFAVPVHGCKQLQRCLVGVNDETLNKSCELIIQDGDVTHEELLYFLASHELRHCLQLHGAIAEWRGFRWLYEWVSTNAHCDEPFAVPWPASIIMNRNVGDLVTLDQKIDQRKYRQASKRDKKRLRRLFQDEMDASVTGIACMLCWRNSKIIERVAEVLCN